MKETEEIILISDNHSLESVIYDIPLHHAEADYFFHCGDSELPYSRLRGYAAVRGNNDFDPDYPLDLFLTIGSHRFFLTHGNKYYCGYELDSMLRKAQEEHCDIVCFGHTHRYTDVVYKGVRFLNPGSIWRNRDGSPASYMKLLVSPEKVEVIRMLYPFPLQRDI